MCSDNSTRNPGSDCTKGRGDGTIAIDRIHVGIETGSQAGEVNHLNFQPWRNVKIRVIHTTRGN